VRSDFLLTPVPFPRQFRQLRRRLPPNEFDHRANRSVGSHSFALRASSSDFTSRKAIVPLLRRFRRSPPIGKNASIGAVRVVLSVEGKSRFYKGEWNGRQSYEQGHPATSQGGVVAGRGGPYRCAVAGYLHQPARRGGSYGLGAPAWSDGLGRVPAHPPQLPRRGGRLPGCLPRFRPQGGVDRLSGVAGQLALWRGPSNGVEGASDNRQKKDAREASDGSVVWNFFSFPRSCVGTGVRTLCVPTGTRRVSSLAPQSGGTCVPTQERGNEKVTDAHPRPAVRPSGRSAIF
jgi:hypothetical protein